MRGDDWIGVPLSDKIQKDGFDIPQTAQLWAVTHTGVIALPQGHVFVFLQDEGEQRCGFNSRFLPRLPHKKSYNSTIFHAFLCFFPQTN